MWAGSVMIIWKRVCWWMCSQRKLSPLADSRVPRPYRVGQVSFAGKEVKAVPLHGTRLWRWAQREVWLRASGTSKEMDSRSVCVCVGGGCESMCVCACVCWCTHAGWTGIVKGKILERNHKKRQWPRAAGRGQSHEQNHFIQGRPCVSHSVVSKPGYGAKGRGLSILPGATQESDLVGWRQGPGIYPFEMAFWVTSLECSATEPV